MRIRCKIFIPQHLTISLDSYAYMKIISSQNVDADFCIIADNDSLDPEVRKKNLKEGIKKKIGEIKDDAELLDSITILKRYAIEAYLLDADILHEAFDDLKKEKLQKMISLYHEKYDSNLKEVGAGKIQRQEFQKYFTPKNFFNNDIKTNDAKYAKFSKLFDNTPEFLETRELIASQCENIERKGGSIISFILSKADPGKDILKEPIQVIEYMLKRAQFSG